MGISAIGEMDLFEHPEMRAASGNLYGSGGPYDEAVGPRNPHHFLQGEEGFVLIDDIVDEYDPNRTVVRVVEDPSEQFERLYSISEDDPRLNNETNQDIAKQLANEREMMQAKLRADPAAYTPFGIERRLMKLSTRNFGSAEMQPVKAGAADGQKRVRNVTADKRDKRAFVRVPCKVAVAVREHRHLDLSDSLEFAQLPVKAGKLSLKHS